MKYGNLKELIDKSITSRNFFMSLSPADQSRLHKYNEYIHTAEDLHNYVYADEKIKRYNENSSYFDKYFF